VRLVPEQPARLGQIGPRGAHVRFPLALVRLSTGADSRRPIVSASSFTVTELPVATFTISPCTLDVSAARRLAATTLSTYVKSRDCSPSPYTVTGRPSSTARMKRGTTAAYCDSGSWRGPKTLKYRSDTISIAYTRLKLVQKRSAASFATAYGEMGSGSCVSERGSSPPLP